MELVLDVLQKLEFQSVHLLGGGNASNLGIMNIGKAAVVQDLAGEGEGGDEQAMHVERGDVELLVILRDTVQVNEHDDKGSGAALGVGDEPPDVVLGGDVRAGDAEVDALGLIEGGEQEAVVVGVGVAVEAEGDVGDKVVLGERADKVDKVELARAVRGLGRGRGRAGRGDGGGGGGGLVVRAGLGAVAHRVGAARAVAAQVVADAEVAVRARVGHDAGGVRGGRVRVGKLVGEAGALAGGRGRGDGVCKRGSEGVREHGGWGVYGADMRRAASRDRRGVL